MAKSIKTILIETQYFTRILSGYSTSPSSWLRPVKDVESAQGLRRDQHRGLPASNVQDPHTHTPSAFPMNLQKNFRQYLHKRSSSINTTIMGRCKKDAYDFGWEALPAPLYLDLQTASE